MTEARSNSKPTKPEKPYRDFPLFPHGSGKWAKKINGRMQYFGRWDDPEAALAEYKAFVQTVDDPLGRKVGVTLADAANAFLRSKLAAVEHGRLSQRSYTEYRSTMKFLLNFFGRESDVSRLSAQDFRDYHQERAKVRNLISLGNEATRIRTLFNWLKESELIDELPRFPSEFSKPSRKQVRRHKREVGDKTLSQADIKRLLDASGVHWTAWILLGLNAAYGPSDIANLRLSDWDGSANLDVPRIKTEVPRMCHLWPETIAALNRSLECRFDSATPEDEPWFFLKPTGHHFNFGNCEITKMFKTLKEWSGVRASGFYALRHTFLNVAESGGDSLAAKAVMGHAPSDGITDTYRHSIDRERVVRVCMLVRTSVLI